MWPGIIIGLFGIVLFVGFFMKFCKDLEEDELKLIERGVQRALDAREKRK